MSWNFRKVSMDAAALAAALRNEASIAPVEVRERCAKQVEAVQLQPGEVIFVESQGHYETPQAFPSWGESTEKTRVFKLPLVVATSSAEEAAIKVGSGG